MTDLHICESYVIYLTRGHLSPKILFSKFRENLKPCDFNDLVQFRKVSQERSVYIKLSSF